MKKDVLLGVAILVLSLLLCACGSNPTSTPESPTNDQDDVTSADVSKDKPVQDEDSLQAAPETEILPGEGQYDEVLASGDGYYFVSKWVENYQEAYTEYGIIDQDENWLVPLSQDNEIAEAIETLPYRSDSTGRLEVEYANDGMFVARREGCGSIAPEANPTYWWGNEYGGSGYGNCMINAETGHCYGISGVATRYHRGFCFYMMKDREGWQIVRMDTDGEESVFYLAPDSDAVHALISNSTSAWDCFGIEGNTGHVWHFGEPSNGLIYIGQKFYDIETGQAVIDLTEYDMFDITSQYRLKFDDDGTFTFRFRNPAKTMYEATVDMNGDFVVEPHEV